MGQAQAENTKQLMHVLAQHKADPMATYMPMMMEAVFYNITIIGEAARHVPDEVAQRYPEIEWAAIRGMRNNLVHEYFGSDLAIVWDTIQHDIPALVPKLGEILREADRG